MLALAGPLDLLDHRPGGAAFEISERPVFMAMFALGVLVALRWQIVGATIAAFTASALVVFASQQLKLAPAVVVIVAFAVPAALWGVVDLNDHSPRRAFAGLGLALAAVATGGLVADHIYDGLFGPSHPSSATAALPESAVDWIWSGAVTDASFSVIARLDADAESVGLIVSPESDPVEIAVPAAEEVDDHGIVRFDVEGLQPDTEFEYVVEVDGMPDRVRTGTVRTFPQDPASFTVAIGSDARVGSNGAVFDAIRSVEPILYLIPGDLHYANITKPRPREFEAVLDLTLSQPAPAALYRSTPVAYVWDDHDFGGNGSDPTTASAPVAHKIFRRYVPHYPITGPTSAIYQAFTIGRVRFILTDGRSARSPVSNFDDANKTMLGAEQKAWFKRELLEANTKAALIVWVNTLPWISNAQQGADDWGGYSTERQELADFIAENRIGSLVMLSGDAHMLAIDDGTHSDYSSNGGAGFPVMHSAALDRPGSTKGGPYSEGTVPGGGHFGVLQITDEGNGSIDVSLSGRNWKNEELISYRYSASAPSEDPA